MLVQTRSHPKPPDPSTNHHNGEHRRFAPHPAKNLDFSTWFSDNLYKILAVFLLLATVAALFFLRSAGDTAALLCFEKTRAAAAAAASASSRIAYPQISWNSIPPIPTLGPFAAFRSDRWIVVSVSSPPSDALRALARVKGWQLLAVGNSHTPADWSLKGAVFLSLEQQAQLGFRTVDFLPYNSHLRKSVGYLFAIQHGAKLIFDADDRAEVVGADLGKHFDLDLAGEAHATKHPVLLQYSHADPNRMVVNPYVHFGQRSVWPRGLPLENVGEVGHEEFYTEVFSGRQFIQQGLSNGLPDVDSVFYFTRKSLNLEAFDIRFDEEAPKVALPQGMMVPVNSFNTLFHTQAFWGLMLPVSVSSMASDVLRGYWAQRILWEIGGYVAIYPPTIHRVDRAQAYPFSEEKDLHVNVGRLIKFLVRWRSKKQTLFERILHLSYAMAEEGFWMEKDVKFTAAWLQDLLAVGYQQPRLMSLELDRPRATIGHGDRREFIPRKLPSVHLGVEESGTVSYEIGNIIRWRKNFGNVVLIMYCSAPVDRTALEWRLLYGRIFKTVIILSEHNNTDLAVEKGQLEQAYKYLPKVFDQYKGAEGFLFVQDNMILNYWNLLQADKTKLWITNKVPHSWVSIALDGNGDQWFKDQGEMVKKVVSNFPVHFQVSYKESMSEERLIICSSEIFYVPQRFGGDFIDLVGLVGDLAIHHKIAVPMFFLAMDSPRNFDSDVLAKMVYKPNLSSNESFFSYYTAQAPAVYPLEVHTESDFIKLIRIMAAGDPLLMELV
ncbi:probable glycosyltransferase STELLO1 [Elaeis guineensis]|uniref:Probable glycosyltransferase STELLO1 n=1 Tax=Elaeis guineensis var. tenera TaxID=51953 RepID=A0A6I9SF68_ELAGV|nr:probable glycosyltransferase STELLO1 [Elaeis guineensis]